MVSSLTYLRWICLRQGIFLGLELTDQHSLGIPVSICVSGKRVTGGLFHLLRLYDADLESSLHSCVAAKSLSTEPSP